MHPTAQAKNEMLEKDKAIDLFRQASKRVPAYKDFLSKNKVNPSKVKTWEDFQEIPSVDKKNYLRKYPMKDLCWDGTLNTPLVFTSTSSSTGEPFYFARNEKIDWQSSIIYENFLKQNVLKNGGSTLVVVCFGMGVWIGGLIAYESFKMIGRRGNHPISIITPGINKKEIFEALRAVAPNFDQVVLVGYPPFIKDVIDEALSNSINLKKMNLKLIFAAEIFTEKFRDYIVEKTGMKNPYLDILHIYGSADIGTMAWETGVSTLVKRIALKDKKLFASLFSGLENKVPTLAQYNPEFINFEAPNGEILLTGDSAIPLVRYSIGDRGGVFSFKEMQQRLSEHGYNLKKEIEKADITKFTEEFPFVYVYERIDFSTTIYGLQIFPEMIRDALLDDQIKEHLTGKFTLLTNFDKNHDQYLEIHMELQKGASPDKDFDVIVIDKIVNNLSKKSSEFRELQAHLKERALPKVIYWPFEHETHFKPGIKQKWINK